MQIFYENRVLVATVTALGDSGPRSNRGHLCPFEKPTIDLRSESIVATPEHDLASGVDFRRTAQPNQVPGPLHQGGLPLRLSLFNDVFPVSIDDG